MSEQKTCIKCQQVKPLDQFYRHSAMADGHLGKCIECCKSAAIARREVKLTDPVWVKQERARCRVKQDRLRVEGRAAPHKQEYSQRWIGRNQEKRHAQNIAAKAVARGLLIAPELCESCHQP